MKYKVIVSTSNATTVQEAGNAEHVLWFLRDALAEPDLVGTVFITATPYEEQT